jgi:hypothetical protein
MFLRAYTGIYLFLGGKLKFKEIDGTQFTFQD